MQASTSSQDPRDDGPDGALARKLEQRTAELDQLAYVVSHDLRAPLRGIANLSQWIEEDLGDQIPEETASQLALLRDRVQRMDAMIQGILSYSRVGRGDLKIETMDVRRLIEETADLLDPPPGLEIALEGDFPMLQTSRTLLEQVFLHLIGNAVKHGGRAAGRVCVTCLEREDCFEFHVVDGGPGIAPRNHDRIFLLFQTLESRDKVEGAGMGLALVKKIVDHVGGAVAVRSEEGHGADFSLRWPKLPPGDDARGD